MKSWMKALLLLGGCFAMLLAAVGIGSVAVPAGDVLAILWHKLFFRPLPAEVAETTVSILWTIRLPRVLLTFCTGAALSVSGAVMQSVLRNPLASSYTLGVSSGASLGAAAVILTGFTLPGIGSFTLPLVGLLSGFAAVGLSVTFASRMDRDMQSTTIVLAGMVFSLFINAFLTILYAFAGENTQRLVHWQMGSFALKGWAEISLLFPAVLVGILLLLGMTREMDILTFGEEDASTMGVNTRQVKWLLLGLSAALTGVCVAFVGVIGFVDLIVPHAVRRIFGPRHRALLPGCVALGGGLMVLCDLLARTLVAPVELPVGAVTALIGSPFFAYVYFRRKREASC